MATYYIDTNDFTTATSIWTNSNLTVKAANGFYQKDGVYRQMSGGELLPSAICPECGIPCGGTISESGEQGIYYLNVELGSGTGAVVVNFDPFGIPDGISALFNSVVYNGLSSPNYGWLQGTVGLPTYVGLLGSSCSSTVVSGSPYTLNEFEYDGSNFVPLGTTTSVSIVSGQIQFTSGTPGNCVIVIPKTSSAPTTIAITAIGPCTGTAFDISVACPAALPSFSSSTVNASSALACSATINQTYYVAHVNGAAGTLGLYDLVFSDANGQFKLSAGFYKTNDAGANEWYQVDSNGVIIAFGDCLYSQFTVYFDVTTNPNTYGWASSSAACAGTGTPLTVYITGTEASLNAVFLAGKVLYTNIGLTTPLNGNNTWYKTVSVPASGDTLIIDGVGVISSYGGPC